MKKKVDIGSLVKEKLEGLDQVSEAPQWDAVLDTLETREKMRNTQWWIGSIVCALILIMGISFLNKEADSKLENKSLTEQSNTPIGTLKANDSQEEVATANGDNSFSNNNNLENSETLLIDSSQNKQDQSKYSNVSVTEFDSIDPSDGATVKTTYYYYRDADNTEVVTKDIKLIDSLLQKSKQRTPTDSIR